MDIDDAEAMGIKSQIGIPLCCPSMEYARNRDWIDIEDDGRIYLHIRNESRIMIYCLWCGKKL